MKNEPLLPPIASPHGGGESDDPTVEPMAEIAPCASVHLSLASALRSAIVELMYPANLFGVHLNGMVMAMIMSGYSWRSIPLIVLWPLCSAGVTLLLVVLIALWRLSSSPRFEVEVRPGGVRILYPKNFVWLTWSRISWVIHFGGHIWIASAGRGCLISRECFASSAQSRQFAGFVRQLWRTDGAAWETTFGQTNLTEMLANE